MFSIMQWLGLVRAWCYILKILLLSIFWTARLEILLLYATAIFRQLELKRLRCGFSFCYFHLGVLDCVALVSPSLLPVDCRCFLNLSIGWNRQMLVLIWPKEFLEGWVCNISICWLNIILRAVTFKTFDCKEYHYVFMDVL